MSPPDSGRGELPLSPLEQLDLLPWWKRAFGLVLILGAAIGLVGLVMHAFVKFLIWLSATIA